MKKLSLVCALLVLCCLLPALACAALPEYEYTQELTYGSFTLRIPHSFVHLSYKNDSIYDDYMDGESNYRLKIKCSYSPKYKNSGELIEHCLWSIGLSYDDDHVYEFARADECLAVITVCTGFLTIDVYNRGEYLTVFIDALDYTWDAAMVADTKALAYALLDHISAPETPLE